MTIIEAALKAVEGVTGFKQAGVKDYWIIEKGFIRYAHFEYEIGQIVIINKPFTVSELTATNYELIKL